MNKLVRNERRKLSATYVNGVAIAIFAVGGFAPLVSFTQSASLQLGTIILALVCFGGSFTLHWLARRLLDGMEE